jgi:hypothetical protein
VGIHKPYDRILKSLADEDPRLLLQILGLVPAGVDAEIQPLRPETSPPVVLPDYVAIVRTGPGEPTVVHAEFESSYYRTVPRDMARYGGSLASQHQIAVESALVLLRPAGVPVEVPEIGHYDIGPTHTTHPYKVVRFWELDPTPVLETNNPRLVPFALLMNLTDEQACKVGSLVATQGDEEAVARYLILGSIRYDIERLNDMLVDGKSGFERAISEASPILREERAKGREEGRQDQTRRLLKLGLRARFPSLENLPEIDRISSIEKLESLIESIFQASDQDTIHDAIVAGATRPN